MSSRKRFILGLVLFCAGIVLLFIAINALHQISEAKTLSHDIENFFTHNPSWNPIIKFFGGQAQEKISSYDAQAMMVLVVGIILTVAGAMLAFVYRRKKP